MLKPSEIRIGNLVTVNSPEYWPQLKGIVLEVIGINQCKPLEGVENTDYAVQLIDRKNYKQTYSQFICFIEPIKSNEKLFTSLGLQEGELGYYYKKSVMISVDNHIYIGETETWIAEKNYIHELQNLYFDIEDEELVLQD